MLCDMLRNCVLLIIFCCCLYSLPLAAQDEERREEARQSYLAGNEAFKAQDYREARKAYQKAYDLIADPRLLFNIAQCYFYAGDKTKALPLYREFLQKTPEDTPFRDLATTQKQQLEVDLRTKDPSAGTRSKTKSLWYRSALLTGIAALGAAGTAATFRILAENENNVDDFGDFDADKVQGFLDNGKRFAIAADVLAGVALGTASLGFLFSRQGNTNAQTSLTLYPTQLRLSISF
jgi:tetratricopeptide (TPR) repeat protein